MRFTLPTSKPDFVLGIIVLIAIGFFLNLWGPALFDLDEGAFSAATMEMLLRQDFVTTYLNGVPRFDKPILVYWLQAISTGIFGTDEFFYRLPSAVAAGFWAMSIYRFAKPRLGEAAARAAFIFMVCSVGVVVIARAATADALLNLWIALACLDGYRAAAEQDRQARVRSYLWIGLGLLTKGPVAVMVPLVTLSLYSLVMRSWKCWSRVAIYPLGWLLAGAIALPWYVLEYQDQGQLFIDGFFLKHNLSRFTQTMEGHGGNFFYYFPALLLITLPFCAWVLRSFSAVRDFGKDALTTWCLIWFVFVFVFFSFSNTQLPHYLLYGSTPLFLMMSKYLGSVSLRWSILPALVLPLLFLIFPMLVNALAGEIEDPYLAEMLVDGVQRLGFWFWMPLLTGIALLLAVLVRETDYLRAIFAIGILHTLLLCLVVLPAAALIQQAPVKEAAQVARSLGEPVIMYRTDMPSFSTYLGRVTPKSQPRSGELVFTRLGKIEAEQINQVLFRSGGIMLVRYRLGSYSSD